MSQELVPGQEEAVTLATTVTRLTVPASASSPQTIIIWESDVAVYIVVAPDATDGGALPTTGRPKVATSALPFEYDVSHAGFIGVAGESAGTARVELR